MTVSTPRPVSRTELLDDFAGLRAVRTHIEAERNRLLDRVVVAAGFVAQPPKRSDRVPAATARPAQSRVDQEFAASCEDIRSATMIVITCGKPLAASGMIDASIT